MNEVFIEAAKLSAKYPKLIEKAIQYGTAGFRTRATELPHVMFRMGLLAVLRSKAKNETVGVMITASHNPEEDNGVKLIDPSGEMLETSWESLATSLANIRDDDIASLLAKIASASKIDLDTSAEVYIAHDTRSSSYPLSTAVKEGVDALCGKYKYYGLLTTPQLHYMVCCKNSLGAYGKDTEEGYYEKLTNAFFQLTQLFEPRNKYTSHIKLDGANGIGAMKIKILQKYIGNALKINLHNDGSEGKLNHRCGADFVKVQQKQPDAFPMEIEERCVSYDGDADRIVYFYLDSKSRFHLLDGDKISTLVADYLKNLLKAAGLNINLCVVQTAYANGNSTNYISNVLNIPVACVPTGVKHLHHRAQEDDIGIYFEANGHGTALFSSDTVKKITQVARDSTDKEKLSAAKKLLYTIDIINQTVGDAIADMLLVESVLQAYDWNVSDWDKLYQDLPNRQLKVKVSDRTVITTTDAERKCVTPQGLQTCIDEIVAKYENGRSFVRPSGTEDIIRVYAEAKTQENADSLAHEVALAVHKMAGGVGDTAMSIH